MSILTLIQSFCKMHALSVPSSIVGATDTQILQLAEILNEVISEATTESKFNVTNQEAIFSCKPMEDQGAMTTLAPNGYQFAIFETFFDRTLRRPLTGPVSETEWQRLKALPSVGVYYKFRIRQDRLLLYPIPTAPYSDIAFEYMSSWAVKSAGGTLQSGVLADNDTIVFPDNIIKRGLAYRWKQIKGLPYQEDQKQFYNLLNNYIAKDKVGIRINISEGAPVDLKPGVFVPSNSWMQ